MTHLATHKLSENILRTLNNLLSYFMPSTNKINRVSFIYKLFIISYYDFFFMYYIQHKKYHNVPTTWTFCVCWKKRLNGISLFDSCSIQSHVSPRWSARCGINVTTGQNQSLAFASIGIWRWRLLVNSRRKSLLLGLAFRITDIRRTMTAVNDYIWIFLLSWYVQAESKCPHYV